MAVPSAVRRRRRPPAVAWILVLAVLVGVAAALLSRPVGGVAPTSPTVGGITWTQVAEIVAIAFFVSLGLWLFLSLRELGNRSPVFTRIISTALIMILLGVLFVAAAGLVHFAPMTNTGNSTGTTNSTGGGTGNRSGNVSLPPGPLPGITLPSWAGIAVLLAVAVVAVVLLVPSLLALAESRRQKGDGSGESVQETRQAIEETLRRLSSGDEADARAAILGLYARLLLLIGARLGQIDSRTPGEIRRGLVDALHVRPRVAQDLTEVFEEARYSSHAMPAEAVGRARRALAEAIDDLARSAGVPS